MKRQRASFGLLVVLLLSLVLSSAVAQERAGLVVDEQVASAAIAGNRLGDAAMRNVSVYLPPSYSQGERRYPVLYLLHGYFGSNRTFQAANWVNAPAVAEKLSAQDPSAEFIIVMPNGRNTYAGSFFTDSAAAGGWETFLTRELVDYIDAKYRTVRDPAARGIAGHSMGGYAALKLAMKHPDVFGSLYALSPCCMQWGTDLSLENPAWEDTLKFRTVDDFNTFRAALDFSGADPHALRKFYSLVYVALAAAWSPDPTDAPMYVDYPVEPVETGWRPVPNVAAQWSANMIVPMTPQYYANLRRLRGIAFDVGRSEEFDHILTGSRDLSRLLTRFGITHTFEEYEGDHSSGVPQRFEEKVIPFFSSVFRAAASKPAAVQPR